MTTIKREYDICVENPPNCSLITSSSQISSTKPVVEDGISSRAQQAAVVIDLTEDDGEEAQSPASAPALIDLTGETEGEHSYIDLTQDDERECYISLT